MFKTKKPLLVMLLIALLPLPPIINYMQRFVVRNGVVTSFRYEVLAPIDGVVDGLLVVPGSTPGKEPALRLRNKRVQSADICSSESACQEKKQYYKTLEDELSSLELSLAQSRKNLNAYIDKAIMDLDQSLAILQARLTGEEAARRESELRRKRILQLAASSVATQEDADRVEAEHSENESHARATQLEIEQLKQRRRMLAQGLFPHDVSDGGLQIQNRIDTLQLDILACKRRMGEARNDLVAEEIRLEALKEDVNNRSAKASLTLPDTAVLWEVDVQNGMEVAKGDRLLSYIDRSRLMVEVAVDDATLELVQPGHQVRARLFGRSDFIDGKVSQVMGSAGIWHSNLLAATVKNRSARDGRVLVQIEDSRLYNDVGKFCGVGRTAYVEFEGIGLLEQYFGAFLR